MILVISYWLFADSFKEKSNKCRLPFHLCRPPRASGTSQPVALSLSLFTGMVFRHGFMLSVERWEVAFSNRTFREKIGRCFLKTDNSIVVPKIRSSDNSVRSKKERHPQNSRFGKNVTKGGTKVSSNSTLKSAIKKGMNSTVNSSIEHLVIEHTV